jgi:hypothetical protein
VDDATRFIRDRMASAGAALLPSVCPLAVPDDAGLELVHAGCAVLTWYRSTRYLLSAAHVVEACPNRQYYIGTRTGWREIEGSWRVNSPNGLPREKDAIDLAYKPVTADFAESLDGCRFLSANEQTTNELVTFTPPHRSKYLVLGYPTNRFRFIRHSNSTVPESLGFSTTIASPAQYVQAKLSPGNSIVLEYEWKAVIGDTGLQRSPKLDGISGGAIFRFPIIEGTGDLSIPQLVGITVEERRQDRLLVGTRLGVFHYLMNADRR